jgi:hypothetical protein
MRRSYEKIHVGPFQETEVRLFREGKTNKNARGIDEEVTEKDDLLADICEQI